MTDAKCETASTHLSHEYSYEKYHHTTTSYLLLERLLLPGSRNGVYVYTVPAIYIYQDIVQVV